MPAKTNGPTSSSDRLNEALDRLDNSIGFSSTALSKSLESEVTRLLTMGMGELRAMSPDELGEAAYCLTSFAIYLQRRANREQARATWAEESVKKTIRPLLNKQRSTFFEEKRQSAIAESEQAVQFEGIRVEAQVKLHQMSYLAGRVDSLAKCLLAIQAGRRTR